MSEDTLFNLDDYKFKSEFKCKDCEFVHKVEEYSANFYYCKVCIDFKTHNNMKKIKLKNMACRKFSAKT